jgi:hypothetical protein
MWRSVAMNRRESRPAKAFRIHRWVLWWFYVGAVCGIVAVSTILLRDLTRTQEHILIFLGVMHWLLGGLVCWACEGIQMPQSMRPSERQPESRDARGESREEMREWHPASDFVLPGTRHTILPQSRVLDSREMVDIYNLRQREPVLEDRHAIEIHD